MKAEGLQSLRVIAQKVSEELIPQRQEFLGVL